MLSKSLSAFAGLSTLALTLQNAFVAAQSQYGDQYWHERYHGILSMAAYGDYSTLCPQQTFTESTLHKSFPNSNAAPWTLLETFGPTASGLEGFTVIIPEMDKVVIVFKGIFDWLDQFGTDSVNINDQFGLSCGDCMAHGGAVQAYQEAKSATNNWAKVQTAVQNTGHQWSITGHGFGGMVAQVASIDLGWAGLSHWSHNHGSPRVFNLATAQLFEKLYEGEAGQRVVANNDALPNAIPESNNYVHAMQGIHIYGNNPNYGMYMDVCTYRDDPSCEGGNSTTDTWYYYTQVGSCGAKNYYSASAQAAYQSSMEREYSDASTTTAMNATGTATGSSNSTTATVTGNATVVIVTETSTSTSGTESSSANTTVIQTSTVATVTTTSSQSVEVGNAAANVALSSGSDVLSPSASATGAGARTVYMSTNAVILCTVFAVLTRLL